MKLGKLGKSAAQNENKLGDNSVPWANQVPSWASKKVENDRRHVRWPLQGCRFAVK